MELLCKGRMTHQELEKLYDGRIGDNSILLKILWFNAM